MERGVSNFKHSCKLTTQNEIINRKMVFTFVPDACGIDTPWFYVAANTKWNVGENFEAKHSYEWMNEWISPLNYVLNCCADGFVLWLVGKLKMKSFKPILLGLVMVLCYMQLMVVIWSFFIDRSRTCVVTILLLSID